MNPTCHYDLVTEQLISLLISFFYLKKQNKTSVYFSSIVVVSTGNLTILLLKLICSCVFFGLVIRTNVEVLRVHAYFHNIIIFKRCNSPDNIAD